MNGVLLTQDEGSVRILTMNRPDKRNALNIALTRSLLEGLGAAEAADSVRCIVLTGAGQAFCAGADLPLAEALKRGRETNKRMRAFRKP